MMRGTFANIRIRNEMAPGTEGGFTKLYPEEKVMPVYDAVVEYKKRGTDLVVIGGKEYGTGQFHILYHLLLLNQFLFFYTQQLHHKRALLFLQDIIL